MAYRSLLGGAVYEASLFDNGEQYWAITRIGEADEPERTYSVACSLTPMPAAALGTLEFSFTIIEMDVATGHEHSFWNGADTKHFLTPADRNSVGGIILDSIDELVAAALPDHIFMQACNANLPAKALHKYERILETFVKLGYGIEEQPEYHGRKSWWMERHHA